MAKPLSKRRQAELKSAFRIAGQAFAELLMRIEQGERATTDAQAALAMVDRLQQQLSYADWERFTATPGFVCGESVGRVLFGEPVRRKRMSAAAAKKLTLS